MYEVHLFIVLVLVSCVEVAKTNNIAECEQLARRGDCKFYDCIEKVVPCGSEGYVLGYGRRYCYRFLGALDTFTEAGAEWVDNVKKCLINDLYKFYKRNQGDTECPAIKEHSFNSHPTCYLESKPGFCAVVKSPRNIAALFSVYEFRDFFGPDYRIALSQVAFTAEQCARKTSTSVMESTKQYYNYVAHSIVMPWLDNLMK